MSFPDAAGRGVSASPPDAARVVPRSFPRGARLTRRGDFLRVYERGARVSGPNLVLFGIPSGAGECRLGITATRKCGGAVIRNLLKRRLREVFRSMRHEIPVAMDLVVNVRRGADTVPFGRLRDEMARLSLELARKVSR